jgi:hypothetical protein
MFSVDASDARRLASEFPKLGFTAARVLDATMATGAQALVQAWQANAAATAGEHGKHYPASIDSERLGGIASIEYEVGPNPGMPQGGMSFEEGSVNQPPHLDGEHAAQAVLPQIVTAVEAALGRLL